MNRYSGVLALCLFLGASLAHAGGFAQPNQSAAAAGVANAFVATANDASAMAYNPAGIAWQDGVSGTIGMTVTPRDSSVILPGGRGVAPNSSNDPTIGHGYLTWMPHDGRFGFGFAGNILYQIKNNWGTAFGANTGLTDLTVGHIGLDGVYVINSDLAVALGVDLYTSRITLNQGAQSFRGTDYIDFGGHASLLWKPLPGWSVGAMFRSGATMNLEGDTANTAMKLKLPDTVVVGVAHDFYDTWRLEADVNWTRWSAVHGLNVVTGGVITQSNPLNLHDTFTVMTGLTWTWRENSQFRLGYAFEQGANESNGFHAAVADQDGHRVSIGVGGEGFGVHMDIAYSYVFYPNKEATGTFAGIYRDRRQAILLSVSKRF